MAKDTTKIKVVEKTPGRPHIDFSVSGGKKVTFGDDELTINLAARERDEAVTLDICIDAESGIVIGVGGTAQKYEDGEDEMTGEVREVPVPIPFDISLCTITLWEV